MELPAIERFGSRVDAYTKGRPGYAAAAFDALLREVPAGSKVVDLGAGTGISSRALRDAGYLVTAVEPNAPMRTHIGEAAGLTVVAGTAESTGLPGGIFAMATAFQAAHWFGPTAADEIRRVLEPGGAVALVWNERIDEGAGAAYQAIVDLYKRVVPGARDGSQPLPEIDRYFGVAGFVKWEFDNPQILDREALVERAASSSYLPNRDDANFAAMAHDLDAFFDRWSEEGVVQLPQKTEVFFGRV